MARHPTPESEPLVLIVPGLDNSGPTHWQSIWERQRTDCERVDLGMWDQPHRNTWVNQLNLAIRSANRPLVLAAHSLGCLAVAWWAQLEQPVAGHPVLGALLVAPPDVDFFPIDDRLTAFSPTPSQPLPFPAILVGSHNDPYLGYRAARRLARTWGCRFADAGRAGHINADSDIGEWPFGQFLLEQLLRRGRSVCSPASQVDPSGAKAGALRLPQEEGWPADSSFGAGLAAIAQRIPAHGAGNGVPGFNHDAREHCVSAPDFQPNE